MKWARGTTSDGTEVTGVIVGDMLHPRAALGSDQAVGEAIPLDNVTLLAPVAPGKFIGLWNNFKAAAEKNGNEARRQRSKRLTLTKDRRFAQAGSHDVSDAALQLQASSKT